jgi:hypothetical protein
MAAITAIPAQPATKKNLTRFTTSDLIVVTVILASLALGGLIKFWNDTRTHETEVAGVSIAYPDGWLRLPVTENEQIKAISTDDGQSELVFSVSSSTQEDVTIALASGSANQSSDESDYTQLSNVTTTVDGVAALQTDYAYVKTKIGTATAPKVVEGRQVAWIKDGQLYVLALEGLEDDWDSTKSTFNRLVDKVEI